MQAPIANPVNRRCQRDGFTLIELIVVIMIVAILAAFLLPAISSAFVSANNAKVVVEIKNMENAISLFKTKFGVEPPSQFTLCITESAWNSNPSSKALVRRIWSNFDFAMPTGSFPDWWKDSGKFTNDQFTLNAGECLVFFLGGVIADQPNSVNGTSGAPIGFSSNSDRPFAPNSPNRIAPFFEFDPTRLQDTDGNGMPEYLDPLPSKNKRPYLYFSSYDGTGYRVSEELYKNNGTTAVFSLRDIYRQSNESLVPGSSLCLSKPAYKANGFQIICAGYDGEYGMGGVYSPDLDQGGLGTLDSNKVYVPDRDAFDNITNFSTGVLKK